MATLANKLIAESLSFHALTPILFCEGSENRYVGDYSDLAMNLLAGLGWEPVRIDERHVIFSQDGIVLELN
jgi:hypothetical protein